MPKTKEETSQEKKPHTSLFAKYFAESVSAASKKGSILELTLEAIADIDDDVAMDIEDAIGEKPEEQVYQEMANLWIAKQLGEFSL